MADEEKKLTEMFRQLSQQGRVDLLSHANTVLRAETGVKKEFGINAKTQTRRKARKPA